jgi:hypothetical protein
VLGPVSGSGHPLRWVAYPVSVNQQEVDVLPGTGLVVRSAGESTLGLEDVERDLRQKLDALGQRGHDSDSLDSAGSKRFDSSRRRKRSNWLRG